LSTSASARSTCLVACLVGALLLPGGCGRIGQPARRAEAADAPQPSPPPEPAAERLRALGARVRPFAPGPTRGGQERLGCGVEDGVVILRGPTGVRYSRPPRVRGSFALKLAQFEKIAQEEAQLAFGKRLARI
jgi:hypothetical protein